MEPILSSIIIPAKNESSNLPSLIDSLAKVIHTIKFAEVIVINDGSNDDSDWIIRPYLKLYPWLKYHSLKSNIGKSLALAVAIDMASGENIITLDADLQIDNESVIKVHHLLNYYDYVLTFRTNRSDGIVKKIASLGANSFRNYYLKEKIKDAACPLKGMKTKIAKKFPKKKGLHRFYSSFLQKSPYKGIEIPIGHKKRLSGTSHYHMVERMTDSIENIIWYKNYLENTTEHQFPLGTE